MLAVMAGDKVVPRGEPGGRPDTGTADSPIPPARKSTLILAPRTIGP